MTGGESLGKGLSSSNYLVVKESGGIVVEAYAVYDKIVNTEESGSGYTWVQDNRLYRISGDVSVVEFKDDEEYEKLLTYFEITTDKVLNSK